MLFSHASQLTVSVLKPEEVPTAFLHYQEKRGWSRPNLLWPSFSESIPFLCLPTSMVSKEQGRVTCSAPINFCAPNFLHYGDLTHCTSLWSRASHTQVVQPQQGDLHIPQTHTVLHSSFLYSQPLLMEKKGEKSYKQTLRKSLGWVKLKFLLFVLFFN